MVRSSRISSAIAAIAALTAAALAAPSATAQIPATERQALIALYNSTNGAGWTNRTNWRNATDTDFNDVGTECTWYGVTCSGSVVSQIDLHYNQLVGTLPAAVGDLANLQTLYLDTNRLSGTLPASINAMPLLETFRVRGNQLAGPLSTALSGLSSIVWIDLGANLFTGPIPGSLTNLARVQYLFLDNNPVGGSIPAGLGTLTTLLGLHLDTSQLTGPVPAELGSLTNLRWLTLSGNALSGSLPPQLGNLSNLRQLELPWNAFSGKVPAEVGNLTQLTELRLEGNVLTGPLPASLTNLTLLTWLDLGWNAYYSTDVTLTAFLNARQTGGDWQSTQTVAPTNATAAALGATKVAVSWTPIAYTADSGGYEVHVAPTPGGPYTLAGRTANKSANSFVVTGLLPSTKYYFVVKSVTEPHANNQNTVTSEPTAEFSATTPPAIPPSERAALIALYNSTNGAGWTFRTNWRNADDTDFNEVGTECTWYGIVCTAMHVTWIQLGSSRLSGPIPLALGDLSHLQSVNMVFNRLDGTLPPSLSRLSSLQQLLLTGNQLSGRIPPEYGNLTALTNLDLSVNLLDGRIPPEFGNLTKLRALGLSLNALTGPIPREFGRLTGLVFLQLNNNALVGGIPAELGNLQALSVLILNDNHLDGTIPAELGRLGALRQLWLHHNRLSGALPPQLGGLASLQEFPLYGNALVGAIPAEFQNLSGLLPLLSSLAHNGLWTNDPSLLAFLAPKAGSDWPKTQTVAVTSASAAALSGSRIAVTWTPIVYTGDSGGYEVHVGTTPGGPYTLAGRTANKSANSFVVSGLLPATKYYFILKTVTDPHPNNQNTVTSEPTPEFSATTAPAIPPSERAALIALYNSTNGAGWAVRTNWRNATDTDFNDIGTECTWFGVTCVGGAVWQIDLRSNNLGGQLPPEIGNLRGLQRLVAFANQLSGSIPNEIGALANLDVLAVGANRFTGSIPSTIGALTKLRGLHLYSNRLGGPIPPSLGSMKSLIDLQLQGNMLVGPVPPELGQLTNLIGLYLDSNDLTGGIPPELGNLTALGGLGLSRNHLTGPVPSQFGKLTNLAALSLGGNLLDGSIPDFIGSLTNLQYLDLAGGRFAGSIPPSWKGLVNLRVGDSDLRWNAFYTSDESLSAFLNLAQRGGDWRSTQTVVARSPIAAPLGATKVAVSWTPILYTADSGGYEVHVATTPGGPYTLAGRTANKSATSFVVTGLLPSTTYYFIVKSVTDPHVANPNTVTSEPTPEFSATTAPALSIVGGPTLPPGLVGQSYLQTLSASGGSGSYGTFGVLSGTLPNGLMLSAMGAFSGVPSNAGDFAFTVGITDSEDATATAAFTLRVAQAPAITSPDAAIFTVGRAGSFAVTATGFPTPAVALSGARPGGVTFDQASAVLAGTPVAGSGGTYPLNVSASNGAAAPATQVLKVLVYGVTTYTAPTATGTGDASVQLAGGGVGCGFGSVGWRMMTDVPVPPPAGWEFAHGVLRFTADTCTAGATLELKVTLPSAPAAGAGWWAYGATPDDTTPHWYRLPATLFGSVVTVTITDGGPGDEDGVANGVIVHRGAPGAPVDGYRGTLRRHLKAGTPVFGPPPTTP